ncbi:MAG TPA: hypothetical protein VNK49_10455 [Anaerolineales bacterium]|nr:hypothetical protein [Anaerolineales bacterium]
MARRKSPTESDEVLLKKLETRLAGTLKPIQPSSEFVRSLRERIRIPAHEEIVSRFREWRRLFFVFGGVMSGLLLVITLARALFHLAGRKDGM